MSSDLTHTRNSLPEKIRIEMAALLQARLADSIDLMMQAKQARWNVKGANFTTLHTLFEVVSLEASESMETMAERIVQLGGTANGTIRLVSDKSRLPAYPSDISKSRTHVAEIAHALAYYGELLRRAVEFSNKLNDTVTEDIFTEIVRGVDHQLRLVEAHEHVES